MGGQIIKGLFYMLGQRKTEHKRGLCNTEQIKTRVLIVNSLSLFKLIVEESGIILENGYFEACTNMR